MFEGYRLSPQQRELWILGQGTQHTQLVIAIEGPLDKELLLRTLHGISLRHEILRTDFRFMSGMKLPVQVVAEDDHLNFMEYDLLGIDEQGQQKKTEECLKEAFSSGSNGGTQPRLCIQLFILAGEKYLLGLTLPSVYADSVALNNLMHELVIGYTALLDGIELPEVSMQYADIAQWLNDLLSTENADQNTIPNYMAKVEQLISPKLPYVRNSAKRSLAQASMTTVLTQEVLASLNLLAERYQISLASTLMSCWHLLLWQLTERQAFAIGTTFDGRNYAELEDVLGPLAIHVPVYIEQTEEHSWVALAQQLHHLTASMYNHQEDFIWEKVALQYQLALQAPQFSFGFEFMRQQKDYEVKHTTFSVLQQRTYTGQFDLKLNCMVQCDSLAIELAYDPAIYSSLAVSRLLDQLETVVKVVLLQPETAVDRISILGMEEQKLLLYEMNETTMILEPTCLHHLFEAQVRRTPQNTAVTDEHQTLTYEELDTRANRLARYLQISGVRAEVLVALYDERSAEMLVAMLAILKAGGAYVPLDPALSLEQVKSLMADAHIEFLLTTDHSVQKIDDEGLRVICLTQNFTASLPAARPIESGVTPLNLAYVIFTSGSTGKPKGVAIGHQQISNYVEGIVKRLDFLPGCTFALVSTFAADLGNTMLFPSICTGGTLSIIAPERATDPEALGTYLSHHPVDYLKIVPAHLVALLSGTQPATILPHKKIILGGESLHWSLVERLQKLRPGCSIVNHYGPAETTVGALVSSVNSDCKQSITCPVGYPLTNIQAYLLDSDLHIVPTMMTGEIYIGGAGVGRGYLGQPELTAERFIPDPFSPVPGGRLYRTGDLGRYLLEGGIEFLRRADNQIKIRGFRVEPDGIEAQLRQHPHVREAVVLASSEDQEHRQLTAYIVPVETAIPTYKGRERYVLPNNLSIVDLNTYETDFFYQQIFVDRTEFQHDIILPEGAVVFDVGANIGIFTLFIRQFYKDAKIYAFEPIPPIFEVLQINAELYASDANLFPFGLSDSSREETFTYYPQSSCQSGYYADIDEDMQTLKAILLNQEDNGLHEYIDTVIAERTEAKQFVCCLKTLSDVMRECAIEHIDLLKIDVEKSELDILKGIAAEDWQKIDQIVIEAHGIDGRISILSELLEQKGYNISIEQSVSIQNTTLYNFYARRGITRQARQKVDFNLQLPSPYPTSASLTDFLMARLPHYMFPSHYIFLSNFPLTANGKIDRIALQKTTTLIEKQEEKALTRASTEVETILAKIWQEILGRDEVGIHDNFFSLGGDSILAILVVGHASKAGLHLVTKQIFQHPTIAKLAHIVESEPTAQAEQGLVTGNIPLTPIQQWFFETVHRDRHHWNQAVLLKCTYAIQPQFLQSALQSLLTHHDMLRVRFFLADSQWQQYITSTDHQVPLQLIDLVSYDQRTQKVRLKEIAAELQKQLNLEDGRLVQAALFNLGGEQRLFIVLHHLLVDGISWRILLEDLQHAYEQIEQKQIVQLPAKTTSFKQWSESLMDYAHTSVLQEELAYWLQQIPDQVTPLTVDYIDGVNTVASERSISLVLTQEETTFLLQQVPQVFNTQINDVLIATLAQAFASWSQARYLLIDLEGHGREHVQEKVELSRTVGWFTSLFPVALDLHNMKTCEQALKYTKELLRKIPLQGAGYGLLRYLNEESSLALSQKPQADVRFNYLSQIEQTSVDSSLFTLAEEEVGPTHSAAGLRSYLFDVNGRISNGRLRFDWLYSDRVHSQATVEELVDHYGQSLRAMLAYCRMPNSGGYTPSDFPRSKLNQDDLDNLLAQLNDTF